MRVRQRVMEGENTTHTHICVCVYINICMFIGCISNACAAASDGGGEYHAHIELCVYAHMYIIYVDVFIYYVYI